MRWIKAWAGEKWHILGEEDYSLCGVILPVLTGVERAEDGVHQDDKCKNCLRIRK